MSYKPDNYHQTNPPCELKRDVMGRQGSKKGQKESTPSGEGSDASTCSAIEFSHDDFSTVRFEKESGSDIIIIHDPHNAWKDWYTLTETQAHDLKCWLERNFQQNV